MKRNYFVSFLILCCCALQAQLRQVVPLEKGWRFIHQDVENANRLDNDDSQWMNVTVPHDWAIKGPFDMNIDKQFVQVTQDGEKKPGLRTGRTGALPMFGIGWYRKNIEVSRTMLDKHITVEFDGAMSHAQVFLNGELVGEWPYGYSSFSFDLTGKLREGNNLLAVRLDNPTESSRWYTGGGIYRDVRLLVTDKLHVAHWGTSITTPAVTKEKCSVKMDIQLENRCKSTSDIRVVTFIQDKDGKVIARAKSVAGHDANTVVSQVFRISHPQLWSPDSPYLYKAVTKVYEEENVVDVYETPFGIRNFKFDKDKGFFLNGSRLQIKGVCLHHDLGPIGTAVNVRAIQRQLEMLKDMGCNAIRTSHNPAAPQFLDLCDQMGFLVMEEAFDEWKAAKMRNGYNTLFNQWAEKDLTAMIHRDRNHPSIIMWSIGNEVNEQGKKGHGASVAKFLADICHREDATRPVTSGFNSPQSAIKNGLGDVIDIIGINYINASWRPSDYVKFRKEFPNYTIIGSETQSTVSSNGVYKLPFNRKQSPNYPDYQVSSYDTEGPSWFSSPDEEFAMLEECPGVSGEFVWTGFDYLGEPTPYNAGTPSRSSYFGIIDLAGFKKDRYYLFQSHWSNKPMIHLLPHWNWHEGDKIPVMCYTNYPKAELFLNGQSLGMKSFDGKSVYERYRLIWPDVNYEPGELRVVGYDRNGVARDEQVIKTSGAPASLKLTADRMVISADGKDLCFITAEAVDREGNLCPLSNNMVFVNVKGNGVLKALCNGDATDQTAFSSNYYRMFNGKMLIVIQATEEEGDILIEAVGAPLKSNSLTISSKRKD